MRCSCILCGTYMVQQERGIDSYCICPNCQNTCSVCMGSGTKMEKGGGLPLDILLRYEEEENGSN